MNLSQFKSILYNMIISFTIITLCINFILIFKYIYYIDIKFLKLENLSGFSYTELKTNYNYLINFLYSNTTNFSMPYFNSSKEGIVHFLEVKNIIKNLNFSLIFTIPISITYIYIQNKKLNYIYLKYTSIILFLIPIFLITSILINFNKTFILFHKILFNNDYWLFDENLDPVIKVLPESFFMHEGIILLSIILFISLSLYIIYHKLNNN